jgi:hypothetical protein
MDAFQQGIHADLPGIENQDLLVRTGHVENLADIFVHTRAGEYAIPGDEIPVDGETGPQPRAVDEIDLAEIEENKPVFFSTSLAAWLFSSSAVLATRLPTSFRMITSLSISIFMSICLVLPLLRECLA